MRLTRTGPAIDSARPFNALYRGPADTTCPQMGVVVTGFTIRR
jgi:hypothetical protein